MMSCCPVLSVNFGASSREIVSLPPPGGYGTIKRTGFVGKFCAKADAAIITAPAAIPLTDFMALSPRSIYFNSRCLDHFRIQRALAPHECGELIGGAADDLGALFGKALAYIGTREHGC